MAKIASWGDKTYWTKPLSRRDWLAGEFSSILASPLSFLPSLDNLGRPCKHLRWNRQADLLCRLQIDDELEFCRLLDRKISRLSAFQYLVDQSGGHCIPSKPTGCAKVPPE
jgi:hypothetical protein